MDDNKCTCDIITLMKEGCKCGAFKKEQTKYEIGVDPAVPEEPKTTGMPVIDEQLQKDGFGFGFIDL